MFKATGEFYEYEVNQDKIRIGFFVFPSCEVTVHIFLLKSVFMPLF